jgi:hypothetical protein
MRGSSARARVGHEHAHPERERRLAEAAADGAVADDAERRAGELAADPRGRRFAAVVAFRRGGDATGEVHHHAERQFRHGGDEARRRPRHQHALGVGGPDVNVADVHGAAQEGHEVGRVLEQGGGPVRQAV